MKDSTHDESFLSRWSRRKLAAAREPRDEPTGAGSSRAGAAATRDAARDGGPAGEAEGAVAPPAFALPGEAGHGTQAPARSAGAASAVHGESAQALPAVESLTFDSDFTRFMAPSVDPALRRAALRKLLHDPRFNVMDGLDVYIDDYTKPSPIAPEVARQLAHARYLFAPPRTRINAQGQVEDVADDADALAAAVEGAGGLALTDGMGAGASGIEAAIPPGATVDGADGALAATAAESSAADAPRGTTANAFAAEPRAAGAPVPAEASRSDAARTQAHPTPPRLPDTGEPA